MSLLPHAGLHGNHLPSPFAQYMSPAASPGMPAPDLSAAATAALFSPPTPGAPNGGVTGHAGTPTAISRSQSATLPSRGTPPQLVEIGLRSPGSAHIAGAGGSAGNPSSSGMSPNGVNPALTPPRGGRFGSAGGASGPVTPDNWASLLQPMMEEEQTVSGGPRATMRPLSANVPPLWVPTSDVSPLWSGDLLSRGPP